jgi:alanyl-tRNA synthetase
MYTSQQVRHLRTQFWESKWHTHLQPASLIAHAENKTVLFNVAGMQQLVPYLSGKKHDLGNRLYNIQKCIRTNDIEDIGDERHLSMFEMMGNRSLGDYFKTESLTRSIEFLVTVLGIPKNKLWATVFAWDDRTQIPKDQESIDILKSLGILHIKEMWFDQQGDSDNFWTPGPVWPCGPCCEFYYDRWQQDTPYQDPITGNMTSDDRQMWSNDRYTEIWNNVFMTYHNQQGIYTPLPQKNVDTGMGFERLMMVLQNKQTIFETDIFGHIIEVIEQQSLTHYQDHSKSYRVVMDHSRASLNLLAEGVIPSNEWRWYILRRLIRRMVYHTSTIKSNFNIVSMMQHIIWHVLTDYDQSTHKDVLRLLDKEIEQFGETIKHGQKLLDEAIAWLNPGEEMPGTVIFKLYDTHGFPVELTQEICHKQDISCDLSGYQQELQKAQTLSRAHQNFKKDTDRSGYIASMPATQFVYDTLDMSDARVLKDFVVWNQRIIIMDKTVFYAESGWQVWDRGTIMLDDGQVLDIRDVKKIEGVFLHIVDSHTGAK